MESSLKQELLKLTHGRALFDVALSRFTTLGVGGPAWVWIAPESLDELRNVVEFTSFHNVPYCVVGKGSNILVSDKGYAGVAISLERGFLYSAFTERSSGIEAEVGAGLSLKEVLVRCIKSGYGGLEFAAGIPGTVGGAVSMNAGAYGGEMRDVVRWVEGINRSAILRTISSDELLFEYRRLKLEQGFIITRAGLELLKRPVMEVKKRVQEFLRKRSLQPKEKYSAGSIFKNPEGDSAGKLIEEAGFKGYAQGGARISERHANWIVANGKAKADDIFAIMKKVQEAVKVKFGVTLEPEITFLGFNHL